MFQERARTFQGVFLVLDAVCICLAFGAAFVLRLFHDSIPILGNIPQIPWVAAAPSDYTVLLLVNLVVWILYLRRSRLYINGDADRVDRVLLIYVKGLLLSGLATGAVVFVFKMWSISRLFFGYFFATGFLLLLGKQLFMAMLLRRLRQDHRRHALVIGAPRPAEWFAGIVRNAYRQGYQLVGTVVTGDGGAAARDESVIGSIGELDRVLADNPVEEVFVVGSAREMVELAPIAQELIERGRIVSLVSTLQSGSHGVLGRVTDFDGVPMISYGPMPRDEMRSGVKRLADVTTSGVALLLLSPVLLALGILIKLSDPGPVLFGQDRLGLGGQRFRLYKFRTMRANAEEALREDPELYARYVQNDYKLPEREDPRISPLGRFLRRTSLDELPQLWNVFRGDMTLVGPRPIVPAEIEKYEPYADLFLSVRPGITGHWQVSGRSEVRYPERAFLDLDYIGSHSFVTDLAIILRTVPAVIRRKGAF